MRIPDSLFPIINRVMRLLLNSPLHPLMSGSVMIIYYAGRKTGKPRWTPVRYLREDDGTIVCLTGRDTGWWPNFLEPLQVTLQLRGRRVAARAQSLPYDLARKEAALRQVLAQFPADAPYHGLVVDRGRQPSPEQFREAVARDVVGSFVVNSSGKSA